jgi:hypothetical protein
MNERLDLDIPADLDPPTDLGPPTDLDPPTDPNATLAFFFFDGLAGPGLS